MALDILRQYNVTQVEIKYKAEFLSQLLISSDYDEKDFIDRARAFNWDLTASYATLLIEVMPEPKTNMPETVGQVEQDVKTAAALLIDSYCREQRLKYFLVNNDDGLVLFIEANTNKAKQKNSIDKFMHNIRLLMGNWQLTAGIGGSYKGYKGIKRSYREAKVALELGKYLYGIGTDIYYHKLGFYGLLLKHTELKELRYFVEEVLGPLLAYDSNKKGELIKTLEAYLECNWNVKETAAKLYTHYNTVLYRINKIKQLTGIDFDHPDQKLNLVVAMRLAQVIKCFGSNFSKIVN